jgi:hypothetical protein
MTRCPASILLLLTSGLLVVGEASPAPAGSPRRASRHYAPRVAVPIRHLPDGVNGWSVAETPNFRIYHQQSTRLVDDVALIAEQTRVDMQDRWLGRVQGNWEQRCDIYLHATGRDYWRSAGVPALARGSSRFTIRDGAVASRSIDLPCDQPNLLAAVLPHEVTHMVLAGQFGDRPVPRWADEGMAVLAEPDEVVEHHLRKVSRHRDELFNLRLLVEMDYPKNRSVDVFYAQSVSLVNFLVGQRGAPEFVRFVKDGLRDGYGVALRQHYGYRDFHDLDHDWARYALDQESPHPESAAVGTP